MRSPKEINYEKIFEERLDRYFTELMEFESLLKCLDDKSPYAPFYQEMGKVLECAVLIGFNKKKPDNDPVELRSLNIIRKATKLIDMTQQEISDSDFEQKFMPIAKEMADDATFLLRHEGAGTATVDMKKDPVSRLATACLGGLLKLAFILVVLVPSCLVAGIGVMIDTIILEPLFGREGTMELERGIPSMKSETLDKLMSPTTQVVQTAADVLDSVQNSVQSFQEKLAALKRDGEQPELESRPTKP